MIIMFIVVHYEGNTSGGFMYLVFTRMPGESQAYVVVYVTSFVFS